MKIIAVLLCVVLAISMPQEAFAQKYTENHIKALFIYKITKFIEWPHETVKLCFIENAKKNIDSINNNLKEIVSDQKHSLEIISNYAISSDTKCDAVFIDNTTSIDLSEILLKTNGNNIVTISDINSFARRGGMFALMKDESDRIAVELNYKNAKANNIKISTNLLEMIKVISR